MWVERLHEDFTTGLGDLLSMPKNGSVSVVGGNLRLQTPGGVNCDWWDTTFNAPTVYQSLNRYSRTEDGGKNLLRIQWNFLSRTKLSGDDNSQVLFSIFRTDGRYAHWWRNHCPNPNWWNGKNTDGVSSELWGWVNLMSPPRYIRVYINRSDQKVYVGEIEGLLSPWNLAWAYSSDGITWTRRVTYDCSGMKDVGELNFGVSLIAYSGLPSWYALFDDLYVHEWDGRLHLQEDPPDKELKGAGLADDVLFGVEGGDLSQLTVPGLADSPEEKEDAAPLASGFSDSVGYTRSASVPQQVRHTFPMIEAGLFFGGRDTDLFDLTHPHIKNAMEDASDHRIGDPVQFRQDTLDPEAHVHFSGLIPSHIFYYRTAGEPWANPTTSNFTGYARNGFRYTNGVQDPGPIKAPWAQEIVGGNRSNRDDFPLIALLVVTQRELVIFDMDNWPTTLGVWMRFELSNTDTYWKMLGGPYGTITSCAMRNGTLVVGLQPGSIGGVLIVDLKADNTQNVAHMIRSDGHWWWSSGYDLRNRNDGSSRWTTSGVPTPLSIYPEYVFSVDVAAQWPKAWVALAGEDASPQIIGIDSSVPKWVGTCSGKELGVDDSGDIRRVLFDESGWLWFSIDNNLFRAMFDYKGGILIANQQDPRQKGVEFKGDRITALAQGRNYVYVGTTLGVYRVHKGSLRTNLAYTIEGYGGGGLADNPPAGEILAGQNPQVTKLHCISTDKSSVLQVVTLTKAGVIGGVTTIRLTDDFVLGSRAFPDIPEDTVYAGASAIG